MGFDLPWRMYLQPDIAMMIASYAIPFGAFTVMSSTLSPILFDNYNLKPWEMGLCFLAIGCGSAIGSIAVGYLLDYEYARERHIHGDNINLHKVRLKYMPYFNVLFCLFFLANGWLLDYTIHLAAPLIMQFLGTFFDTLTSASVAAIMYYNCMCVHFTD